MDPNVYRNPTEKYVTFHHQKIILKHYKMRKAKHFNIKYNDLVSLISQDSGFDQSTVHNTISMNTRRMNTRRMKSPQKPNEKISTVKNMDNLRISYLRKKIHGMWLSGTVPTIERIISAVNIDKNLPRFNRTAMEKILNVLQFDNVAISPGIFALIEKDETVRWRRNYLENIRRYRNEGRPIYFLGDTLIEASKNDTNVQEYVKDSCPDLLRAVSEKKKKFIVLHIGSADGFVHGGLLGIESIKDAHDYEENINCDIFLDWFKKVLPLLKENAVIVMNHTSYNSQEAKNPNKTWKNDEIIKWLESKGQIINNDMIKVQLIDLVKTVSNSHLIDDIANENNKVVLRIPTYHSELNPIEMAWQRVKNHVNTKITPAYEVMNFQKLIFEGIDLITPKEWFNIVEYTMVKEEADCWNVDCRINIIIDNPSALMVKEKMKTSNIEIESVGSQLQSCSY